MCPTPLLAAIAVASVVHGRRRSLLLLPLALGVVALACTSMAEGVTATLLTALGCLTLGAALVRLTPTRALHLGLLAMALVDIILLAAGVGQPAADLLGDALNGSQPAFHYAELGPATIDYPDLVLAAILGGISLGPCEPAQGCCDRSSARVRVQLPPGCAPTSYPRRCPW